MIWKPIDTAPSGEAILVFPNAFDMVTVANAQYGEWWDSINDNMEIHPTHWMPFPEKIKDGRDNGK